MYNSFYMVMKVILFESALLKSPKLWKIQQKLSDKRKSQVQRVATTMENLTVQLTWPNDYTMLIKDTMAGGTEHTRRQGASKAYYHKIKTVDKLSK